MKLQFQLERNKREKKVNSIKLDQEVGLAKEELGAVTFPFAMVKVCKDGDFDKTFYLLEVNREVRL